MPYSHSLAERVRQVIGKRYGSSEKKMFGGVVFFLHGNMLVGVWKNSLIARLGAERAAAALAQSHVVKFDITGKPMKGWVMVEPEGLESEEELRDWIGRAMEFVETLPRK